MRRRRNRNQDEALPLNQRLGKVPGQVLAVLVLLLIVDWGLGLAWGWIPALNDGHRTSLTDQELALAYGSSDLDRLKAIRAETERAAQVRYRPLVEYAMVPFKGRHVTIDADGVRGSGGHAASADTPLVVVLGGSTSFGLGLADDETIPARLAQSLAAADKPVRMMNVSALSWYSSQERIALERLLTQGVKPALAIFIDGLSDFQNCASPDRSALSERLARTAGLSKNPSIWSEITARSHLIRLWYRLSDVAHPESPHHSTACQTQEDLDRAILRLDTNRRLISGMADQLGFKVLFVQQPVPTYQFDNTRRPVPLGPEGLKDFLGSGRAYPRMEEMRSAGRLLEDRVLWLAGLESGTGAAYLDAVHYSPDYSKLIAETLARHIQDNGLLP